MAKPIVLHIGDPVKWNTDLYEQFAKDFTIVRPSAAERQREEFMKALKEKRWGDFVAIFRPFWNTGGEMGRWDKELIPLLPSSCKISASAGAGFDWVDVDLLAERGIIYCNSAAATADSVSDFAMFLIIATFRNLTWCTQSARASPTAFTECHQNAPMHSRNLKGMTLGIIGLGNIGYTIAKKAYHGFGMEILYYDIFRKTPAQEAAVEAEFFTDLEKMISESDCVLLATPATPDGKKVISRERIAKFKKGGRFVNIARGTLVDEEAMADAVESGNIVGVGMDVHENEPKVSPRLAAMRQATLTAHNAGGTLDTHIGFEELSMKNITSFLKEGKALTPVNMHMMKAEANL